MAKMYDANGEPRPAFIWGRSPMECHLQMHLVEGRIKQKPTKLRGRLRDQLQGQLQGQLGGQLEARSSAGSGSNSGSSSGSSSRSSSGASSGASSRTSSGASSVTSSGPENRISPGLLQRATRSVLGRVLSLRRGDRRALSGPSTRAARLARGDRPGVLLVVAVRGELFPLGSPLGRPHAGRPAELRGRPGRGLPRRLVDLRDRRRPGRRTNRPAAGDADPRADPRRAERGGQADPDRAVRLAALPGRGRRPRPGRARQRHRGHPRGRHEDPGRGDGPGVRLPEHGAGLRARGARGGGRRAPRRRPGSAAG